MIMLVLVIYVRRLFGLYTVYTVQAIVELDLGHVAGTTMVRRGMELDLTRLRSYLSTVLGKPPASPYS